MRREQIVHELVSERDRLNQAIGALQGGVKRRGRPAANAVPGGSVSSGQPNRRKRDVRCRAESAIGSDEGVLGGTPEGGEEISGGRDFGFAHRTESRSVNDWRPATKASDFTLGHAATGSAGDSGRRSAGRWFCWGALGSGAFFGAPEPRALRIEPGNGLSHRGRRESNQGSGLGPRRKLGLPVGSPCCGPELCRRGRRCGAVAGGIG